ncbi:MAG: sporulation integral membrane protein YtvI [Clostridia bacterium]|nr:sporulation integral membrane protein YtvI [Clostridia bacterium]
MTQTPPSRPFDWQRLAAVLFCTAVGALALWLAFRYALGILLPFLLAWLLSRVVKPLTERLCRRAPIPRGLCAAGLVILTVGGAAGLAIAGVRRGVGELTRLVSELAADTEGLAGAVESVLSKLESVSSHIPFLRRFEDAPFYADLCASVDSLVESGVAKLTETVTARLPGAAMTVAGLVPSVFIFLTVTLLACYYFTADDGRLGKGLGAALARVVPVPLRDRLPPIGRRLRRLGRQYLRACLLLGLLTFCLCFIGLAILRVPYAFILALLLAVVDLLPLLGTGVILIPWGIICLLLGQVKLGIGLLVLYGAATLVRQVLEPKLIGEGLGLHPLVSLFSMYAGLKLFGVWGMILAPLVAAGVRAVGADRLNDDLR